MSARITLEDGAKASRVLIVNVTRIGDTLLATPAIRAIARHFPNATITCLGHPKRVEVIEHLPYLGKVGGITKNSAPFRARFGGLTGAPYDWAFVYGNDIPLHQYSLRKARQVVAFRQKDKFLNSRLFGAAEEPRPNSRHAVLWHLALPQSVGIAADGHALDYAVTPDESHWARKQLEQDIGADKRPLIGLQVASFPTKAYRDWPIEHFIKLAKRIVNSRPEARFVLFGGADDRAKTTAFEQELPNHTRVYAGQLSLRQTVAIMSEIDLYIGVDTGPTHLYGALGKPMVAMYHPSLPSALYKPLDHPALYVLDHPAAGPEARKDISMAEISVDTVWECVAAALQGEASRFPGMPAVGMDGNFWPGDSL
jgi:heptosyltransferase-3